MTDMVRVDKEGIWKRRDCTVIGNDELAALRRDAERYRWLRNAIAEAATETRGAYVELAGEKAYDVPEELDAAIDAAMAKEKK